MDSKETVQALMDSVQRGRFDTARTFLSDDFKISGFFPTPINGKTWLNMIANLKMACADLNYHFQVLGSEGNVVHTTLQLSGTNSGAFDFTGINMGVISATNKKFSSARQKTQITVKGDKVTSWAVEPTEGAGWNAILGQLGVKLPEIKRKGKRKLMKTKPRPMQSTTRAGQARQG
jgi:predicted ester cyclase